MKRLAFKQMAIGVFAAVMLAASAPISANAAVLSKCKDWLMGINPQGQVASGKDYSEQEKFIISQLVMRFPVLFGESFATHIQRQVAVKSHHSVSEVNKFQHYIEALKSQNFRGTEANLIWNSIKEEFFLPSKNQALINATVEKLSVNPQNQFMPKVEPDPKRVKEALDEQDVSKAASLGLKVSDLAEVHDLMAQIHSDISLREAALQVIADHLSPFAQSMKDSLSKKNYLGRIPLTQRGGFVWGSIAAVAGGFIGTVFLFQNFFFIEMGMALPTLYYGYWKASNGVAMAGIKRNSPDNFRRKVGQTLRLTGDTPKLLPAAPVKPITIEELKAAKAELDMSSPATIQEFGRDAERGAELMAIRLGEFASDHEKKSERIALALKLDELIERAAKSKTTVLEIHRELTSYITSYRAALAMESLQSQSLISDMDFVDQLLRSHNQSLELARRQHAETSGLNPESADKIYSALGERIMELAQFRTTLNQIQQAQHSQSSQISATNKFITDFSHYFMSRIADQKIPTVQTDDITRLRDFHELLGKK